MKNFALAGNPNSGKTTLFNSLTGSTAKTGNWAGVTVSKSVGQYKKLNEPCNIIDLPGIYSISPYTDEEVVARNYILNEKPDCIINIVDATNLERNLYLTTQLLEIDVPLIIALNMADVINKNGEVINSKLLEEHFNVPVVEISALKGTNLDELMKRAYEISNKNRIGHTVIEKNALYHLVRDVKIAFKGQKVDYPLFHAIKLVENDELEVKDHPELIAMVNDFKDTFDDEIFGSDFEALIADARYKYIEEHFGGIIVRDPLKKAPRKSKSERIDKILTHKIFSIPIFILIMFLMFHFTFSSDLFGMNLIFNLKIKNEGFINFLTGMSYDNTPLSGIPSLGIFLQNWITYLLNLIKNGVSNLFYLGGDALRNSWYASLLCDGILSGLFAVISFIPQILLLFFFIAILEDSGYMARVAFILDKLFKKIGLSGRAFIPMLTGFGCSVPAIMSTRTLSNEKEKNRTIRLITCFSCGAKAPIWTLLASIGIMSGFSGDLFVFVIYLGGVILAILLAIFMKLFSKNNEESPFLMELPQYRLPQIKNVFALLWDKLKHYLIKAGTIIASSLVIVWFLESFRWDFYHGLNYLYESDGVTHVLTNDGLWAIDLNTSILGSIGNIVKYIFYPLGWAMGDDGAKYVIASFTGIIAKENVVASLSAMSLNSETIMLSKEAIYSFAIFNLLTVPCIAAISTAYSEQTHKEFVKSLLFWFSLSYLASSLVYWLLHLYAIVWWGGLILTISIILIIVLMVILTFVKDKKAKEAAL